MGLEVSSFPIKLQVRMQPSQHPDISFVRPQEEDSVQPNVRIPDPWELWDNKYVLSQVAKSVIICITAIGNKYSGGGRIGKGNWRKMSDNFF